MFGNMAYKCVYYTTIVEHVRDSPRQEMRHVGTIGKRFGEGTRWQCMDHLVKYMEERYGKRPRGRNLYHKVPETPYKDALSGKKDDVIGFSHSYWKKDGEGGKSLFHTDCIYTIWCYASPREYDPVNVFDRNFMEMYGIVEDEDEALIDALFPKQEG